MKLEFETKSKSKSKKKNNKQTKQSKANMSAVKGAPAAVDPQDKGVEQFMARKLIKSLENARGFVVYFSLSFPFLSFNSFFHSSTKDVFSHIKQTKQKWSD